MNTKVFRFDFIWQAEQFSHLLTDNDIENQMVFKSREYAQIVTGGSQGTYEVIVDADQFEKAQAIMQSSLSKEANKESTEEDVEQAQDGRRLYSKVIFFSFAAILSFPILFNWVAWQNYKSLRITKFNKAKIRFAKFIFIFGIVVAICEVLFFISEII